MEYGNRGGRRVDEYGNPIPEVYSSTGAGTGAHTGAAGTYGTTAGTGPYGTARPQGGVGAAGAGHGQLMPERERGGHRRSGSSSSSSSEDDGMGGRRKKSIKEKIKEKMPGGHKTDDEHGYAGQTATAPTTTAGMTAAEGGHEKKGMMEKIKEKLPGGHN